VIEQSDSDHTALLLANIGGSSLCSVDLAGNFGRALSAQGADAMVDFAVQWLTRLYGSDIKAGLKKSAVTRWNAAPYVQGAMSAASVGGQGARKVLMEPMNDVFFAGEAVHETLWGTVGGAWESGERAADAVLRRIGALQQPTPEIPPRKRRRGNGRYEANG
jgi:monoamine oxidase